jgi:hypothetical protein
MSSIEVPAKKQRLDLASPSTTELTEAADKKSKVIEEPEKATPSTSNTMETEVQPPVQPQVPPHKVREPETFKTFGRDSSRILTLAASRIRAPIVDYASTAVVVNTIDYVPWFNSLYVSILNALYPSGNFYAPGVIAQDDFVLVCRGILYARVHDVFNIATGRRFTARLTVSKQYNVPKALSDIVNGVGIFTAYYGMTMYPQPEVQPQDSTAQFTALMTQHRMDRFNQFVKAASDAKLINLGRIASIADGTAWWLLSARTLNGAVSQGNANVITLRSVFTNWTPNDGLTAAIVQNQYNGFFARFNEHIATTTVIRDIDATRNRFNLGA